MSTGARTRNMGLSVGAAFFRLDKHRKAGYLSPAFREKGVCRNRHEGFLEEVR